MIFNNTVGVLVALSVAMSSACAATVQPGVSSLLIRRGKPTVSYDFPQAATNKKAKSVNSDVDALSRYSPRERMDTGNTVEKTDKALSSALKSLERADTATNHLGVAAEYRRLRILDKAYDHLTLALERDRRSAQAFEQRAQIWRDWGFPELGVADAHRAVFMAPRSPSAQNTLATLLQSLGQLEAARRSYLAVLDLDPHAAYAWSNLCYLSLLTGNADRAIRECDAALRQRPELHAARNNMALSFAATGRLDEARDELLAAASSPADGAFNVGMMYLAVGSYELAEQSFRTAAHMRPAFSAAERRRRQAAHLVSTRSPL